MYNVYYNYSQSVAVRSLQAAVLARSSWEISQTVRIDCHSVRISVRPSKFCTDDKYPKTSKKKP